MHVQRRVGSIMAHDGDAVHGVTQLVNGIRCRQLAGNECAANCSPIFLQTRLLPYVIIYTNTILAPRYGLCTLRSRSPATRVPLFPPLLLGVKGGEGTHSDRQQVFSAFCVAENPQKIDVSLLSSDCKCRLYPRAIDAAASVAAKKRAGCVLLSKLAPDILCSYSASFINRINMSTPL
jgi:hypothetical protein